ncbi:MAG TPA: GH1 family beta-glucosidase [Polyangia bacterium]|nr:GH1 family beta-glucosidase [Polyangia bacterium]
MNRRSFLGAASAAGAAVGLRAARAAGPRPRAFPAGFVWGAATAAYQIEGAAAEDGKGPSIWDVFCKKPGAIWNGQSGDVACDHYHRYKEDVALARSLGLRAYRFSVSWPRVLPAGTGGVNPKGLDFYDRLVDELLAARIDPWLTLYHWDLPLALYQRGGWLDRDVAGWFADYAAIVVRRLGDRVRHFMPLNEPQVFLGAGLVQGRHAPGDKLTFAELLRATHHALLAHGRAVQAIRAAAGGKVEVGCAQASYNSVPATPAAEDLAAARARFLATADESYKQNAWWLDAMVLGRYPEDGLARYGPSLPEVRAGDLETIRQPLDFLGVNLYQADAVRRGKDGRPEVVPWPAGTPLTSMEWAVTPAIMRLVPTWLHERYALPIVVAENGVSLPDWVAADGQVHDPQRIDFARAYLGELRAAVAGGVPVRGYFHWSLLDNFEWAHGYKQRFGLVHVDFATQKRTLKDSARWYRGVVASNGARL